jgi:hypothetical protein
MRKIILAILISVNALADEPCCPCPSPSPTPAPTAQPTPAPGSAACARIIRSKWLYKPESQDTRDNREGKPMSYFEEGIRVDGKNQRVLDIHGRRICNFTRFTSEGTIPQRYYSGHPGSDYCNMGPKQLAQKALERNGNGTTMIYLRLSETDGENRCIRVPDPTQRYDNRSSRSAKEED